MLVVPGSRKTAATVDHIINRRLGKGHRGKAVLACYGCNAQRNKDEEILIGKQRKGGGERGEILRLIACVE